MMKQYKLISLITWAMLIFLCRPTKAQQNIAAVQQEIAQQNKIYFQRYAQNDNSILALYTDDACLLAPNAASICGRAALAKDFKDTFAAGKVKTGTFTTEHIYGDGKTYVTEEGRFQVFGPDGKLLDEGKYLKLWKATKDGWKIFRDCFNSNRAH